MAHFDLIDPSLSADKTVCLYYFVPKIRGPNVSLILHQNVLFISFYAFLHQFSPWFAIQLTLFVIALSSF